MAIYTQAECDVRPYGTRSEFSRQFVPRRSREVDEYFVGRFVLATKETGTSGEGG